MFSIFPTLTEIPESDRIRRFVTEDGQIVRLFLNSSSDQFIRVESDTHVTCVMSDGRVDRRPVARRVRRPRTDRVWVPDGHGCGDWEYV